MYEIDMEIENLAFKLFSKQMELSKVRNKGKPTDSIEQQVVEFKKEVDSLHSKKRQLSKQL
jgi:hypothetical protein